MLELRDCRFNYIPFNAQLRVERLTLSETNAQHNGSECDVCFVCLPQVKDKEAELKSAEQKLHDEFERLRRQNAEEKRQLDDKKRQLVRNH